MAGGNNATGWVGAARRWAASFVVLAVIGGAMPAYAQMAPEPGFEPGPTGGPGGPAPGAPAGPSYAPGPGVTPPPAAYGAGPARVRGISRAEFIERRRQAATRNGRDPDRVAARAARMFDAADTNHDGIVDAAERAAFEAAHPELMRRGHRAQ